VKKEILDLETQRNIIEKEKTTYAQNASDANMEQHQALERLKTLNETIADLKAKNASAETKLKQQKKIYEALNADCHRFAKKYQDSQLEIKNTEDDKNNKFKNYNYLRLELTYRQKVFSETIQNVEQ
jgi:predicted RNase H-like nuclease (RuvC/YqgF family)